MEVKLRDECKNLLSQLTLSQKYMKEKLQTTKHYDSQSFEGLHSDKYISSKFGQDITDDVNIAKDTTMDFKPTYARNKLMTACKSSTLGKGESFTLLKNKENHNTTEIVSSISHSDKGLGPDHRVLLDSSENAISVNPNLDTFHHDTSSIKAVSPSRMKKRQIIDKHTTVPTKLNAKELRELDDERLLNFSYTNINVDKDYPIKSIDNVKVGGTVKDLNECVPSKLDKVPSTELSVDFQEQLQDVGNDRRHNAFFKQTSIKPKTLLNSTDYYGLSKRGVNSRVKFKNDNSEETDMGDPRLLGYDWIAALMDNEQSMLNQSESFFDELCDFRRAFKQECSNQFYTQSPYTLVDREPEPVVEALTEPKVRPFVVNERLFTEPLSSELIESDEVEKKTSKKEPSKDNPRFVRVSIPRSTLQTPYRVKPHRRRSFDGSDSCSLVDHCLLGWENSVPSMIPPAKSLSLATDAGTQINSQTTTLAEAERLAKVHNQVQWHLNRPQSYSQVLPRWRKHYMDTTLNLSLPSKAQHSVNASTLNQSSVGGSRGGDDVKRKTDRILHATYSTMYEMERLRQQRELDNGIQEHLG